MTVVVKKDGRRTPFYIEKIGSNLDSAERVFGVTYKEPKENILERISQRVTEHDEIQSGEIFKIIESELKEEPLVLLAFKEFKRIEQENITNETDLDYQLNRYHNKDKYIMNENGNKDSRTYMTQRDLLCGTVAKAKGIMMYPEKVRRAHIKGIIHLHE